LVLAGQHTSEIFFRTKAVKSLFAYNQGLREGIQEVRRTRAH